MNRTIFQVLLVAISVTASGAPADKPYNVLFLSLDDLRPELNCYGATHAKTPKLDALANDGMIFLQAHCQQAICNPSRASLLTGRYPDQIQVWDLPTKFRETTGGKNVVTLPQHFKNHGFHTSWVGKIFHPGHPDDASWSEPVGLHRNKSMPHHRSWRHYSRATINTYKDKRRAFRDKHGRDPSWLEIREPAIECVEDADDDEFADAVMADHAIDKLRSYKASGQRFFLAVGLAGTHLPFTAPKKYFDLYDPGVLPLPKNPKPPKNAPVMALNTGAFMRHHGDLKAAGVPAPHDGAADEETIRAVHHAYLATISFLDAQVGRIVDELARLGLKDNTIICAWGDHGFKLGEHRGWSKMTNFEIDTRCPLIIVHPDAVTKGQRCHAIVEFVDLYPTLADLAGLPIPEELTGKSLRPLLNNPGADWESVAMSQYLRGAMRPESYDGRHYMGYAVRSPEFRYVEWFRWNNRSKTLGEKVATELYDHRRNHLESENVAANPEYHEAVSRMGKLLAQKRRRAQ